ncbi:MAG: alpha/beta hydrolase [Planctomycetota bacterium]
MAKRLWYTALTLGLLAMAVLGLTLWLDQRAEARFAGGPGDGWAEGFVEADGVRLRYLEAGEGPALVCLHGAYGGAEDWALTVGPTLARDYRVLAFDRPGHGFSTRDCDRHATPREQARSVVAAMDALGLERPLIAGFSWGAAVSAALISEWPDRCAGAALLGAPVRPWEGETALADRILATPVLGPVAARLGGSALARLIAPNALGDAFAPESAPAIYLEDSPIPLALRVDALVHNSQDMAALNAALDLQQEQYDRIRVPVELVHGVGDEIVWIDHQARGFQKSVGTAHLTEVVGAGHQLLYTRGDDVIAAIRRLAARVQTTD